MNDKSKKFNEFLSTEQLIQTEKFAHNLSICDYLFKNASNATCVLRHVVL